MTETEEKDMAAAAMTGESRMAEILVNPFQFSYFIIS